MKVSPARARNLRLENLFQILGATRQLGGRGGGRVSERENWKLKSYIQKMLSLGGAHLELRATQGQSLFLQSYF